MEGPNVDLSEILQQATQLTAEIESARELPRVQRNLRQVLEAGQQLLERTTRDGPRFDAETKAAVFLGTKGVDVTKLSEKLDPINFSSTNFFEAYEPASEVDLEDFLRNERMNAMCAIVETTSASILEEMHDKINMRLHEDWKREKEEITARLSGSLKTLQFEKVMYDYKPDSVSPLSQTELTYALEINQYNNTIINGLPKPNLVERLQLAAKNTGDSNAQELWNTVSALASSLPIDSSENIQHRRSSEPFINLMTMRAKQFLEKNFFTRLQTEVWSNLGESNIGGVPAVTQLVKSYITMRGLNEHMGLDVAAGNVGPIWLITYILLRCGKAADAAAYMRDQVCNMDSAKLLEEYDKSGSTQLPFEMESKIRLEYRRALKNSTRDPYKKAVYCILGGCNVEEDLTEVASRLDDYIWLKLAIVRHNPDQRYVVDYLTYFGFQKLIHEQYGEVHFDAFKQPYVYAQALLLTGQFEAAIEFMSRISSMLIHSIHIAVALQECNILLISDAKAPMLSPLGENFPDLYSINFCKLVVTFARSLEGCNARDALNYLYLLKNIKDERGEDFFSIFVGDMILESRDFDVFGVINSDGCRSPGILDQMGIPSQPIIIRCATESENTGLLEDAVVLYDLGGDNDRALKILCRIISQNMTKAPLPDSQRQRVQRIAIAYAERYQNHPPKLMKNPSLINTFFMLVDFLTFFDTVYSKQVDAALSIIQRLKVLPMDRGEVEKCVDDFHTFPSEIRDNIPSIVSAAMEVIHLKFQSIKSSRKNTFVAADMQKTDAFLDEFRTKAHAIVTFCGMIPYFMTDDIYLKVMQVEVQMN